jgi:hypothetical protein
MHHAEFGAQSINIIPDINIQLIDIHSILVQGVENLLLKSEAWFINRALINTTSLWNFDLAAFGVQVISLNQVSKKGSSSISSSIQRRRLEFFVTCMVKYLADGPLKGSPAYVRSHEWTVVRHHDGFYIRLKEGLGIIFLELVRVHLNECQLMSIVSSKWRRLPVLEVAFA